ncbi:MAG: hypothetical protein JOY92_15670 [Verrucomicrobia bacterium]|nr:hypothetical protein [Verrucomicrobiota bacterium]
MDELRFTFVELDRDLNLQAVFLRPAIGPHPRAGSTFLDQRKYHAGLRPSERAKLNASAAAVI